jgi:hypothetical protein
MAEHLGLRWTSMSADVSAGAFGRALTFWERGSADLVTLESPGGQPFCLVLESRASRRRPTPADRAGPQLTGWSRDPGDLAEHWTTLRDPAGLLYCVTDRHPDASAG